MFTLRSHSLLNNTLFWLCSLSGFFANWPRLSNLFCAWPLARFGTLQLLLVFGLNRNFIVFGLNIWNIFNVFALDVRNTREIHQLSIVWFNVFTIDRRHFPVSFSLQLGARDRFLCHVVSDVGSLGTTSWLFGGVGYAFLVLIQAGGLHRLDHGFGGLHLECFAALTLKKWIAWRLFRDPLLAV